jgi:hypothetical protein
MGPGGGHTGQRPLNLLTVWGHGRGPSHPTVRRSIGTYAAPARHPTAGAIVLLRLSAECGEERFDDRGKLAWLLEGDLVTAVQQRHAGSGQWGSDAVLEGLRAEDGVVGSADDDGWRLDLAQAVGERRRGSRGHRSFEGGQRHLGGVPAEALQGF